MSASSTYPTNRSSQTVASGTLALEPPRHLRLPISVLVPGRHLVGSGDDCDIHITLDGVHQQHALILIGDQVAMVKAVDPRTWINDHVVTEASLRVGDRLSIGPITYRVRLATDEERNNYVRAQKTPKHEEVLIPHAEMRTHHYPVYVPSNDLRDSSPIVVEEPDDSSVYALEASVESIPIAPMIPHAVPPKPTITSAAEAQVYAIQKQLAELDENLPSIESLEAAARQSRETQQNSSRYVELQQLAEELNRQSQKLRERNERIVKREEELERKLSRFATENERLVSTTETTRRELASEYARQQVLWQEWNEAYRRTTEELKNQSEAIEARRATIRKESDLLAEERAAVKKLAAECELERQSVLADRLAVNNELNDNHALRTAFETERRQYLLDIQEREADLAEQYRKLTASQDDLLLSRQQLETDRTLFATERSSESIRREHEIREHTLMQIRLTDEQTELQTMRQELDASLQTLDERVNQFLRDRDQFESEKDELDELRARLAQSETDLSLLQESHREEVELRVAAEREARERLDELESLRRSVETNPSPSDSNLYSTSYYSNEPQRTQYDQPSYDNSFPPPPPVPESEYRHGDNIALSQPSESVHMTFGGQSPYSALPSMEHQTESDCDTPDGSIEQNPSESTFAFRKFESVPTYEIESHPDNEVYSGTATSHTESESVEETISSINRRFGFVTEEPANQSTEQSSEPIDIPSSNNLAGSSSDAIAGGPDPSLDDLRAQLAKMFTLPDDVKDETESLSNDDSETASVRGAEIFRSAEDECHSNDNGLSDQFHSTAESQRGLDSIDEQPGQEADLNKGEDPYARLRELARLAAPELPLSPPVETKVDEVEEAAADSAVQDDQDDEYSVEAQLARLLGKPRRVESPPKSIAQIAHQEAESRAAVSKAEADLADRSHLNAGPKHRQNKSAVREETQSFREVAQMSARTALAKHSWNNLRNEFYFTSCLTIATSVGALWFLSTYMSQRTTGLWEGLTCSIGAGICIHKMLRSLAKLKQFRHSKTSQPNHEAANSHSHNADDAPTT